MMKRKQEIKELDKLWKKMKGHIKAFLTSGDQEQLHQFRVQVKKIKALLTLFKAEPDNKNLLKLFKPIKKVFKKAGEIRNAYINLKLLEEHHLENEDFKKQQQQLLDNGTENFKKQGKKHLKSLKKAHVVLQNHIGKIQNKKICSFYQQKIEEIAAFFNQLVYTDDLHNARKNIKLLLHNQKPAAKALDGKLKFNADYLDNLQNNIGEWHDHVLAIETLSHHGKAEDVAVEHIKKNNKDLEKTIAAQSSNFKKRLNS